MLNFMRNKVVRIFEQHEGCLKVVGLLSDDIYELELEVIIDLPRLKITSIEGRWRRWTTPECPRAIPVLQEAVGMEVGEGFSEKIKKGLGRKSCRHFANLLLECCHAAKDAVLMMGCEPSGRIEEGGVRQGRFREQGQEISAEDFMESLGALKGKGGGRIGGFVVDLHVHTSEKSPCSSVSLEELIIEAKRIGLNAFCLTDHNTMWDKEVVERISRRYDFLVLRGNEVTTDQGDVLVFGWEEEVRGIMKLAELREDVIKRGGFMIAAHPFRGFLTFDTSALGLTPEKASERKIFEAVDAVEVLNSKVTQKENAFALEVAKRLGLPVTGGSDAHELAELGIYATVFSHAI
ncbi:MAG TPA: DUF2889 domain-containing protein, partial [Desulfobacterales bacterium]|nr:DUF2889 domain-containing protein [Desulfobacterales bacterium]